MNLKKNLKRGAQGSPRGWEGCGRGETRPFHRWRLTDLVQDGVGLHEHLLGGKLAVAVFAVAAFELGVEGLGLPPGSLVDLDRLAVLCAPFAIPERSYQQTKPYVFESNERKRG